MVVVVLLTLIMIAIDANHALGGLMQTVGNCNLCSLKLQCMESLTVLYGMTAAAAIFNDDRSVKKLQVIPERAQVGYVNEKYLTGVKMYVRRYTRRGSYYFNLVGTNKQTWANNVTVQYVFYEYLHNEYKRSFVEFEFKLCELVHKSRFIGLALQAGGLECPVSPREWSLYNISLPTHNFPSVWPFEKGRLDVRLETSPEKDHITDLQIYLLFKHGIPK